MPNEITLDALILYAEHCKSHIKRARNISEANFWQQRANSAIKQAEQVKNHLNNQKQDLLF